MRGTALNAGDDSPLPTWLRAHAGALAFKGVMKLGSYLVRHFRVGHAQANTEIGFLETELNLFARYCK